jgi:hypothetical protein
MTDHPRRVTRALLSVSDKSGLLELARALAGHGVELVSTGGTAKAIAAGSRPCTPWCMAGCWRSAATPNTPAP